MLQARPRPSATPGHARPAAPSAAPERRSLARVLVMAVALAVLCGALGGVLVACDALGWIGAPIAKSPWSPT